MQKITQIVEFIAEVDKLKGVLRKTSPIAQKRRENSAEHSWQVILTALLLSEYSNEKIDLLKVVKMLAIHDVVEIDTGDILHYEKNNQPDIKVREEKAARRIFALLPQKVEAEYLKLWLEFEAMITNESKYANSIDRLMAFILNKNNNGGTWKEFNLTLKQVIEKNKHVAEGSKEIWEVIQLIIKDACSKGYLLL